ncbi:hypothetical protein DK427_01760 [Methylobacterium radiodurans]|uniref:Uncharacterized protein n=1 Tax=Methylobacterium radiodurans TaxID=2202828 RepID=A0A2U8VMC6_9HYPH|nr:hypothetical protein DK427_01760 [Methylobacterium radiodurans]
MLAPVTILGLALILILCAAALGAALVALSGRVLLRTAVQARNAARRALPAWMAGDRKKPAAASRAG